MTLVQPQTPSAWWPQAGVTRVPYRLYGDAAIYERERARLFGGRTWNYLCLEAELPNKGDYKTTYVGDMPVVVVRDHDGRINGFENRCSHRGAQLCLDRFGNKRKIACVYHGWTFDLSGNLTAVAFQKGIKGKGGMPEDFKLGDHNLRKLKVETFAGLVFGSFADDMPSVETYLGPEIAASIRRVFNRPIKLLGYNNQVLRNNWKLYVENVKDPYHASILHLFFTTFRINRLSQSGGIVVDDAGGHHVSYSKIDRSDISREYEAQGLRSAKEEFGLADPSLLESPDEFGDGVTLQILTVFPNFVVQQIQNSLAVRQVVPKGIDRTELMWTYFGFADDDAKMDMLRLKQSNLIGPAGYISLEDGAVGEFVQRSLAVAGDDSTLVEMGGRTVESQDTRATETSIRGFWQVYRQLMEV
ncbi:MAG: aromatic ring-hydroxylating dioxygenase subunit alpha [Alphaproteobacteria bacterium]